jgi:mRNA interferase MazF
LACSNASSTHQGQPVCVLTRDAANAVLQTVSCTPITRTTRGTRSEVDVGPEQGLLEVGVISCNKLLTIRG